MSDCQHRNLVLLPTPDTDRLRCRHCHLTISAQELDGGHCPECYETTGQRRRDFEPIRLTRDPADLYRCEQCGASIPGSEDPEDG